MIALRPKSNLDYTARKLNRWQKLFTAEQARAIPRLYSQDGKGMSATVHIKYFAGGLTWLATEFDPEQGLFFGYVVNHGDPDCSELGYFSADDLCSRQEPELQRGPLSSFRIVPVVERDLHFTPCTIAEAVKQLTGREIDAPAAVSVFDDGEIQLYKSDFAAPPADLDSDQF